jgi:hypothetical protein
LILTVRSYRPSRLSLTLTEMGYGYSTGSVAVLAARTGREADAARMRDGEALMFLLVGQVDDGVITVSLPSDGTNAPQQRWVRRNQP